MNYYVGCYIVPVQLKQFFWYCRNHTLLRWLLYLKTCLICLKIDLLPSEGACISSAFSDYTQPQWCICSWLKDWRGHLKMQCKLYLCGYIYLQELTVVHIHLDDYTCQLVLAICISFVIWEYKVYYPFTNKNYSLNLNQLHSTEALSVAPAHACIGMCFRRKKGLGKDLVAVTETPWVCC